MNYDYWKAALAGQNPVANVDDPQPGFYRLKRHNRWVPVAVWPTGNTKGGQPLLGFKFGTEQVGPNVGTEQWSHYCANPVTEAVYRAVAERGENWPDGDPVVEAMVENRGKVLPSSSSTISAQQIAGKLNAGQPLNAEESARLEQSFEDHAASVRASDPTAEFREQIETALGGVPAYAKIASDEADVRALSLRNMLNELAASADKAREAEKAPLLKAEREVDAKWQPMIKKARAGAGDIKTARDAWQDDKRTALAAQQKRQQEVEEQHRRDTAAAAEANKPAPAPPPPVSSNTPPPSTQVRPTYGKASSTGTKMVVTRVDYDKFFAVLKTRPEWPHVQVFFDELAQKLANRGVIPDGVTTEERANTR